MISLISQFIFFCIYCQSKTNNLRTEELEPEKLWQLRLKMTKAISDYRVSGLINQLNAVCDTLELRHAACSGRWNKDEEQSDSQYSIHKQSWASHNSPPEFDAGHKKDQLTRPVSRDRLWYSLMWYNVQYNTLISVCILFLLLSSSSWFTYRRCCMRMWVIFLLRELRQPLAFKSLLCVSVIVCPI